MKSNHAPTIVSRAICRVLQFSAESRFAPSIPKAANAHSGVAEIKLNYNTFQPKGRGTDLPLAFLRPPRVVVAGVVSSMLLAACSFAPTDAVPELPTTQTKAEYTEGARAEQTVSAPGVAGDAQTLRTGSDLSAQWWTLFNSPALNQLIQAALDNSPTLQAAEATLKQADETYASVVGSTRYPSVSAGLQAARRRVDEAESSVPGGTTYNTYSASVNVSYTLDVFGVNRNTLASQGAALELQRQQFEAARLTLTANVVTTAINEAALREQVAATESLLQMQEEQLATAERQYTLGALSYSALLAQRTSVAGTRASLPSLRKSLAQTRHLLSVLVGRFPSEQGLPSFELAQLSLPQELPVSLGSDLVRQRPDILAAEAQVKQAAAQVGVATGNLYPQFTLTASSGSLATDTTKLFQEGSAFWSLVGGVTQPIFNGGALRARKRAAQAALEASAAQYRSTVLQAFQNVADTLRALEYDALTLQQQSLVEDNAKQTADLLDQQYKLGAVSYLNFLDAQRTYQQARVNVISARATRFADTAALFKALGGGWWNRAQNTSTASAGPEKN